MFISLLIGDNISKWVLNTNTAQETNLSLDNKALIYLLWPSDAYIDGLVQKRHNCSVLAIESSLH